ncbi:trrap family protein [Megaselia abdita]
MMYLHQDSGLMNVSYFKFEVDDSTGNLEASRSVPFRLTPNISEFLSPFGISGTFSASVVATARCLVQPNFKLPSILQAILRDEIIAVHRKRFKDDKPNVDSNGDITDNTPKIDMENIINVVNNNVAAIMSRLNSISYFDNMETNKIASLIQAATNPDFLCRMDPAWHPWL